MNPFFNFIYKVLRSIWLLVKRPLQVFTVFLRMVWLLFPAFLFFILAWMAFWNLSQGRDILIGTLERTWVGGVILVAVLFWAMVNWYSSRILIYRRNQLYIDNPTIAYHTPRLLGFLSFSLVWISLLRLPVLPELHFSIHEPRWLDWVWVAVSIAAYIGLTRAFEHYRNKKLNIIRDMELDSEAELLAKENKEKRNFRNAYILAGILTLLIIIANTITFIPGSFLGGIKAWTLFISLIAVQCIFLFIVVVRRGRLPVKDRTHTHYEMPLEFDSVEEWQEAERIKGNTFSIGVWERVLYNANIPQKEKWFFITYNIIAVISLVIYVSAIISYNWSVMLGSLPTVLIAFGVLTGIFCVITFFSVVLRVNFHMVILLLILLFGNIFNEPHHVTLIKSKTDSVFKKRPGLKEYFTRWAQLRKDSIEKGEYPILFTLADGGASRSGYWTAATLGKLQDTTHGKFSEHLFCLSGASGGSVGNGTFLALLNMDGRIKNNASDYTRQSALFLKSDFLSYTLARMLGPDFVRPIFGGLPVNDRAAALERAMENGEDKEALLYGEFKRPFSDYIPNDSNRLPIICINATRVQDGNPSVICNMKLEPAVFGKRVDILNTLESDKDMKLSTAVILGARFPYVSPAGRIGNSYYVDGGYFDNSGAGFIQEMITELQRIIKDSLAVNPNHYYKNLSFSVMHAQNGYNSSNLSKIQPFMNDLAAPLLTLVGAYGQQTSVNDWRLRKYLEDIHRLSPDKGYFPVNLYTNAAKGDEFPMNWAISNYYIRKMDALLYTNSDLKKLTDWLFLKLKINP
ncbi:MAG: patatin-like phospholipase family protein [Chitinophagaceae bacterium]|nr:patatin-like phospholipase family protein [Chitinophagaceae bacterium]